MVNYSESVTVKGLYFFLIGHENCFNSIKDIRVLIELEKAMINPISETSKSIISAFDSQMQKKPSQEYNEFASINVEFSEQAKKMKMLEDDSPIVGLLKSEFDEVFGLDDTNKKLFLKNLDRILANNGLEN